MALHPRILAELSSTFYMTSLDIGIFVAGLIGGGLLLRLIDYFIAWKREKREQHSLAVREQKDRPRFRIDTTIVPTTHATVPAAIVKILSLGSLPLTINQGEVFIEASHYPERVEPQDISGREIGPITPVEAKFSLPQKLINPSGIGEPVIKLVCKFSHSGSREPEHHEAIYNRRQRRFDNAQRIGGED